MLRRQKSTFFTRTFLVFESDAVDVVCLEPRGATFSSTRFAVICKVQPYFPSLRSVQAAALKEDEVLVNVTHRQLTSLRRGAARVTTNARVLTKVHADSAPSVDGTQQLSPGRRQGGATLLTLKGGELYCVEP